MQYPDLAQLLDYQIERERRQIRPESQMTEDEYDARNALIDFIMKSPPDLLASTP